VALKPDVRTGEPYLAEHGASLRAIYDLGDRSASRVMLSAGQSGIVFSPLYRRWVASWSRGEYVPLWSNAAPVDVLRLEPSR
jgi:penicillin amidase